MLYLPYRVKRCWQARGYVRYVTCQPGRRAWRQRCACGAGITYLTESLRAVSVSSLQPGIHRRGLQQQPRIIVTSIYSPTSYKPTFPAATRFFHPSRIYLTNLHTHSPHPRDPATGDCNKTNLWQLLDFNASFTENTCPTAIQI